MSARVSVSACCYCCNADGRLHELRSQMRQCPPGPGTDTMDSSFGVFAIGWDHSLLQNSQMNFKLHLGVARGIR